MDFLEVLKDTVAKVDGAVSAMIIGTDGISVQEYSREKLVDLTGLSAEASAMIKDIGLAADNLSLGEAREFSIISDRCGIIMRKINSDYYLALVIRPDGNYGKGRFILKTAVPKLEGEF
jgi:predicted regulator of Ras-like GTPase activity (Roadblock/LC7/MglB family)